jgi:hypothetical protein
MRKVSQAEDCRGESCIAALLKVSGRDVAFHAAATSLLPNTCTGSGTSGRKVGKPAVDRVLAETGMSEAELTEALRPARRRARPA